MRVIFLVLAACMGCSEFATPAELSRTQVLGLRVEPATLAPGGRGRLSALVAGPEGVIEIDPSWSVADELATIERDADGSWLRVDPDANTPALSLEAFIDVDGGALLATRTVAIEAAPRENPIIGSIRVRGEVIDEAGVRGATGDVLPIEVEASIDTESGAGVAWYATLGEIELYHRASAELEATEPGQGWLIVVCRDGLGGISWEVVPLIIEDRA